MKEMPHIHEFPQKYRVGRNFHAKTVFNGGYRCQMMRCRTYTAYSAGYKGKFEKLHTLKEFLESSDLQDLQVSAGYITRIVYVQHYPRMTFYSCYRINYYFFTHNKLLNITTVTQQLICRSTLLSQPWVSCRLPERITRMSKTFSLPFPCNPVSQRGLFRSTDSPFLKSWSECPDEVQ